MSRAAFAAFSSLVIVSSCLSVLFFPLKHAALASGKELGAGRSLNLVSRIVLCTPSPAGGPASHRTFAMALTTNPWGRRLLTATSHKLITLPSVTRSALYAIVPTTVIVHASIVHHVVAVFHQFLPLVLPLARRGRKGARLRDVSAEGTAKRLGKETCRGRARGRATDKRFSV